jgi:aspartate racemase
MIGILGGMGPYATIAFYKKVLDLTNAKRDSEHFHIWIDSNTKIPSRNRHFIFNEESPVAGMVDSLNKMEKIGIKKAYLPCNSASFFIPEIKKNLHNIELIGTVESTLSYIIERYSRKKVMVVGAYIVYNKEPYKKPLEISGFEYIKHDEIIQEKVEALIYQIKTDNISEELIAEARELYKTIMSRYEIDILVLGCTELCIVFDKLKIEEIDVLDTNYLLASYLVKKERE